jgi:hypothetical protein
MASNYEIKEKYAYELRGVPDPDMILNAARADTIDDAYKTGYKHALRVAMAHMRAAQCKMCLKDRDVILKEIVDLESELRNMMIKEIVELKGELK